MQLVQADEIETLAAKDGATRSLDADVVVAVIEDLSVGPSAGPISKRIAEVFMRSVGKSENAKLTGLVTGHPAERGTSWSTKKPLTKTSSIPLP